MTRQAPGEASDIIRARLHGRTGRSFWRSLEELAGTPAFQALVDAEFPALARQGTALGRRSMLKAMAASLALAGVTGCRMELDEAALPYVQAPEAVVPGKPKWYATAVILAGFAQPALGKTHTGRPVKLEGNPDHPATQGATDPFLQAALLGLYDPDRSQAPRQGGRPTTWNAFDAAMVAQAAELDRRQGEGLRLLTGAVTSPTLVRQISRMHDRWPMARWHVHEPVSEDRRLEATRRVFGRPLEQHLMLDAAEAVVSLDDDILGPGPRQAVHARRWSARRQASQDHEGDCRLFAAEATPSLTGTMAQERLVASPQRIASLAVAIAHRVGVDAMAEPALSDRERHWVEQATAALRAHAGRALVTIGTQHAPDLQALALLINERIGSFDGTLRLSEPIAAAPPDGARSMAVLAQDMAAGRVSMLAMVGVNPAYASPADLGFRDAMQQVPLRLHAGLYHDETAARSHWHVPLAHDLESWSDAHAVDGTVSIVQPLIRPLHAVRSLHAVLDNLLGARRGDRDIVQATWREAWGERFDERWRESLVRGFVAGSAAAFVAPAVENRAIPPPQAQPAPDLTVVFQPDPTVWDGRFAANAWLQETPKPLTKVTWGNTILISPQLAQARGLRSGDEISLTVEGRSATGPAWIMPGQEAGTVVVGFGYGRTQGGGVGQALGYDAFALHRGDSPGWLAGAAIAATGNRQVIATTQLHQAMDGFDFVRTVEPSLLPASGRDATPEPKAAAAEARRPTFYPARHWSSPSWGMAIDLDLCIGCNACVVACTAENNVPVVGKDLVAQGRHMHWLRVDRYHEGDPADPKGYFQPVPCMHCEQAPCEMGCPVNAAVHSADGLNVQVYNRCIGTRTCSSFCPYKVRRFNWFDYTGDDPDEIKAVRNPDVTVRARGVMEKCTYCVQRISAARIGAKIEGRALRDGDVRTACQQACPTQAITFGDVTDAGSEVSRRKASARNYSLLEEANTWPRTTYLARIEKPRSDGKG